MTTLNAPTSPRSAGSFDPVRQPILPSPPLPQLPAAFLELEAIRTAFSRAVPWQVEPLFSQAFVPGSPAFQQARRSAVLFALVQRPQGVQVLLTRRAAHLHHHAGQISFPGGGIEREDADAVAAALRETQEEVGIAPSHVRVLGVQPTLLTTTGFLMTPVIAELQPGFALVPDPSEVAEIFEVPLLALMDPDRYCLHQLQTQWGHGRCYFAIRWQSYFIWGATAVLMRNLYHFLAAAAGLEPASPTSHGP